MTKANESRHSQSLHIALWIAQALVGLTLTGAAVWKLVTPIPKLAEVASWMGEASPAFLHMTTTFDFLGGVGIVLPSLVRVRPGVTVVAALGCAALMIVAVVFHLSRGEAANTPFNFVLAALSSFVAWGRWRRVPIRPR